MIAIYAAVAVIALYAIAAALVIGSTISAVFYLVSLI
jgi:hypothetical protein